MEPTARAGVRRHATTSTGLAPPELTYGCLGDRGGVDLYDRASGLVFRVSGVNPYIIPMSLNPKPYTPHNSPYSPFPTPSKAPVR